MSVDFNHGSGYVPGVAAPSLSAQINATIDAGIAKYREPPRTYLGPSMLADPCQRRVAYQYHNEPCEPFDARTLRTFGHGHIIEMMLSAWLMNAGFKLKTIDPATQRQFAFEDGPIQGHGDGIITDGPLQLPYPLLWEAKGLNDKSWADLATNRLQTSKPLYYGQVNLYMAYFELQACLLTAFNKTTSEIYHELIPFDRAEAQRLVDLAVEIARGWLPPRITAEPGPYCDYCQFKTSCWSKQE